MHHPIIRRTLASLLSLSVLAAFLFVISALTFFFTGLNAAFGIAGILVLEAILFALVWRFGPGISSWMYERLYNMQWLTKEEFTKMDAGLAAFVTKTCEQEHILEPKIGLIPDDNPQAFSFGSDHWNAGIVITRGVLTYLDEDEREAVVAHELGHIVHRDFIVMTLAAFILTALYTIGRVFIRAGEGNRKGGAFVLIGMLSLIFYYIGSYILLYLSRLREYWADEYCCEKTGSGNALSSALVKIAYGIVASTDSEKTHELMEGTRTLGVFDHKRAKSFGLVGADYVRNKDRQAVTNAIAYDLHNVWAWLLELSSSHPLTGKRIAKLLENERSPLFNVRAAREMPFDHSRNRMEFVRDLVADYLWLILPLLLLPAALAEAFSLGGGKWIGILLAAAGAGFLLRTLYRYPSSGPATPSTIDALMSDLYASPVRGTRCVLDGSLIGRGTPGYVFSADFMFSDRTGLLYLDYQSPIPLVGNFIFSLSKAKELLGKKARATGWFYRGFGQHLGLDVLSVEGDALVSRQKTLSLLGAGLFLVLGALAFVFLA